MQNGPVTLAKLCEDTGLQPSKLHRYLVSMVRTGIAAKSLLNGTYTLGPAARRIGAHAYLRFDGSNVAHEHAVRLSEETGHTVMLYSWNEDERPR